MLLIRTVVAQSSIAGLGLFADEDISQGTVIWRFEPKLDTLLSDDDVELFVSGSKEQFWKYAFFDKDKRKYMLCGDDARFFNHSDIPNCDDGENDITVALRDIARGEELTVNYRTFDGHVERHDFL